MARKFGLVLALVLFAAPSAFALCVDCPESSCSYTKPDGTIVVMWAPNCGTEVLSGYGFNNCHNVGNCNGCMGWTCNVRDPEGFAAGQEPAVETAEISDLEVFTVAPDTSAR